MPARPAPARAAYVPLSIKVAIVLWTLFVIQLVVFGLPQLRSEGPLFQAADMLFLACAAYQVFAAARLSRWCLVGNTFGWTLNTVGAYLNPQTQGDMPTLLVSTVILWLIFVALVAPHWRRMNWKLLGVSAKAARQRAQAEVF